MSNIHRAYHAIQRLSTSAGRPTNAVYGFVTMLRKLVREHSPDLLAAAWDGPHRTQRHEAYAEYKANRPAMADDLASQLPEIREASTAYRIPILELPGFEADDVIGTLAQEGRGRGIRRRHRDRRQGHAAARLRRPHPRVPHRQGSLSRRGRRRRVLRRSAGAGGRRARPDGRQRRQRPGRAGRRRRDGEEVDLAIREPRRRSSNTRTRSRERSARASAPTTTTPGSRASSSRSRWTCRSTSTRRRCAAPSPTTAA